MSSTSNITKVDGGNDSDNTPGVSDGAGNGQTLNNGAQLDSDSDEKKVVVKPAGKKAISTPVKKGTPKGKKESTGGVSGLSASGSGKKRASDGAVGDDEDSTPSKKQRGTKLPNSRAELTAADNLMLKLKKEGKSWAHITAEVSNLTGLTYGKSTLGNRCTKILDILKSTEWKDGDVERMLYVRDKVLAENEASVAVFKKKVENETWAKIGKAMVEIGADEHSAGSIEKAYNREKHDKFPHQANVAAVVDGSKAAVNQGEDASGGENEADDEDEVDDSDEVKGVKAEEMEDREHLYVEEV